MSRAPFSSSEEEWKAERSTRIGIGVLLGGGYDFWIGEQWSLGAGARLIYISGSEDDFGTHRALIPTLTFSALLH